MLFRCHSVNNCHGQFDIARYPHEVRCEAYPGGPEGQLAIFSH